MQPCQSDQIWGCWKLLKFDKGIWWRAQCVRCGFRARLSTSGQYENCCPICQIGTGLTMDDRNVLKWADSSHKEMAEKLLEESC